jgi:hypothetical protein
LRAKRQLQRISRFTADTMVVKLLTSLGTAPDFA